MVSAGRGTKRVAFLFDFILNRARESVLPVLDFQTIKLRWRQFGRQLRPYRDALLFLMYSACFSLAPTLVAVALQWGFGRWTGDWATVLANGNLLTASASLMASAVYVLRAPDNTKGFLNSAFGLVAVLVLAFSFLFYGILSLTNQGIIPNNVKLLPKAVIYFSLFPYLSALVVTYRCLVLQHKRLPSNQDVRQAQVETLENQLEHLNN